MSKPDNSEDYSMKNYSESAIIHTCYTRPQGNLTCTWRPKLKDLQLPPVI